MTFLELMQKKAEAGKQEIEVSPVEQLTSTTSEPVDPAQEPEVVNPNNGVANPTKATDMGVGDSQCTIEINSAQGGIELYWEWKPSRYMLNLVRENGFNWNNTKKCWYQLDSNEVRNFLNETFDTDLLPVEREFFTDPEQSEIPRFEGASPELEQFRMQVDHLVEYLNIPPADLMLVAIDCLYRKEIGSVN